MQMSYMSSCRKSLSSFCFVLSFCCCFYCFLVAIPSPHFWQIDVFLWYYHFSLLINHCLALQWSQVCPQLLQVCSWLTRPVSPTSSHRNCKRSQTVSLGLRHRFFTFVHSLPGRFSENWRCRWFDIIEVHKHLRLAVLSFFFMKWQ